MSMSDSKIIALIDALSRDNSILLGSIGIDFIAPNATGNGLTFYMVNGMTMDVPLNAMDFMFTKNFDKNSNGIIDKSEKLQLKDGSTTYMDGETLLKRESHTGVQKATTVTIDKTGFTEFLSDFQGVDIQALATYLDTHKEFLNGLFIGDNTAEGSFKLQKINSKLYIQRLENGVWVTKYEVGSPNVENINLTKDYSSITYSGDNNSLYNVVNQGALSDKTLRFSDPRMDKTFICGDSIEQIKYVNNTLYDIVVQTDILETSNSNTISFDFTTPVLTAELLLAVEQFRINNVAPIESASIIITEKSTGREIYKTFDEFEVNQGLGDTVSTTGEQNVKLVKPVFLIANRTYTYTIKSKSPIQLLGKTINGSFVPFAIFKYKRCAYLPFITKDKVSDSITLNSSDYVASSKAVSDVRKLVSSAVSGVTPMGFISCADFNLLEDGKNGQLYFMADNGIIGTSTVTQGSWVMINTDFTARKITNSDFSYSVSDTKAKAPIFIINVEPMTYGKNVKIIRNEIPDEETVKSIITDDANALKVTVEWDRNNDYYQGVPEVNGVSITSASKNGDTYIGNCVITDFTDNITANLGNGSYIVPLIVETPPVISSATFSSIYPSTNGVLQTELKENDLIPITIVADKPFSKVEIYDYLAGKNTILDTEGLNTSTVNVTIANRGITSQSLKCKVRVCSINGFWSESYTSDNSVILNNTKPSINISSILYPTGQQALKNSESATISASITNGDTFSSTAINGELEVTLADETNKTVTVKRLIGDYNDSVSNTKIYSYKNSNGAYGEINTVVCIANVLPTMSTNVTKIRTGEIKAVNCVFNQKVIISTCSIPTPNYGTLNSGTLPSIIYSYIYNPTISIIDTDIHSDVLRDLTLTVKGMSGLTTTLINSYKIRGFVQKAVTLTYPLLTATVPTIVDMNSLVVSGTINSVPPYNICTQMVSTPSIVSDYNITGTTLTLSNATYMFNYNNDNNITVLIEEL